jgi:site-specific recombinase XerD
MDNLPVPIRKRDLARIMDRELPKYFTAAEVKEILAGLTGQVLEHLVVNLLWKSGVRVSELLAIRKSDVDPAGKMIRVITLKSGQKRTRYTGQGRPEKARKKQRQAERVIPLPNELVHELTAYTHAGRVGDLLFPFTRQWIGKIVKRACAEAGFNDDRAHPHTFRHSFAVHLLRSGVPVTVVRELLGHSNISSTLIYLRITQLDTKALLERVEW